MEDSAAAMDIIENSTLSGLTIRKTILRNCVLRHVKIHASTISNSSMYQCTVYTSTISEECSLEKCNVLNSTITGCTAIDSDIHESTFVNVKMNRCKITTSPLPLRRFAPEIRAMIFSYCTPWYTLNSKAPELIVALRGDEELYQEALQAFYKQNLFRLEFSNFSRIDLMSTKAVENIRTLQISAWKSQRLQSGILPSIFYHCKSIKRIALHSYNEKELLEWIKVCLGRFSSVERMTFPINSARYLSANPCRRHLTLLSAILNLKQHLGVCPRLSTVCTLNVKVWVVQAPKGQTLKWKEG